MGDVTPIVQPDAEQMRRHLAHLFDGWLDGLHDGLVELAWTDGRDGRLRHAQLYGTDQLDGLVEQAVQVNSVPRQNVYVGQALRKPSTAPFGRASDADVLALTTLYVDLDEDVLASARERYRTSKCPPTAVIVTGRQPHVRSQLLWRLEVPEQDLDLCRKHNTALARALGGDTSVVNPSRVLRLAGSVAWPMKSGRVIERTEFLEFADGRAKVYPIGQVARAFPPANDDAPITTPFAASATATLNIGTPDTVSVDGCLAAIRAGQQWHNNMVRLVGHWISRGWSDAEIDTAAEALTLPGYTVEQTRADVARMVEGGRRKWNIASPERSLGAAPETPPDLRLLDWTADRYAGTAKPIVWLCQGTVPLASPMMLAALGGTGKSYLAIDLALQIAAGVVGLETQKQIMGGPVLAEGSAVVVTAEDSFDAIHRRFNRIDPENRRLRHPGRLMVVPLLNAGGPRPLVTGRNDELARTAFFDSLASQLLGLPDLRLVVIDPMQAFVTADITADPAAGQYWWTAMGELAAITGATVMVTHHMRKDGASRIDSIESAREAIRGSTALVDGARLTYALWRAETDVAAGVCQRLGIETAAGRVVQGAVVKANDEADSSLHTYVRQESGLLVQTSVDASPDRANDGLSMEQAREVLREIERRFVAGNPFSHAPNSGARYLVQYLSGQYRLARKEAQHTLESWMNTGVVTVAMCDAKTKLAGLKVLQWL